MEEVVDGTCLCGHDNRIALRVDHDLLGLPLNQRRQIVCLIDPGLACAEQGPRLRQTGSMDFQCAVDVLNGCHELLTVGTPIGDTLDGKAWLSKGQKRPRGGLRPDRADVLVERRLIGNFHDRKRAVRGGKQHLLSRLVIPKGRKGFGGLEPWDYCLHPAPASQVHKRQRPISGNHQGEF